MRPLTNQNAGTLAEAVSLAQEAIRQGRSVSFAGGGSDLLQLMKDRLVNRPGSETPDVLVNLKSVDGLDQITPNGGGVTIGGLTTLRALTEHAVIRERFTAVAEAAETVATRQIRNTGTVAGNVVQRPWCWYYRNGFDCYKAGGNRCYSIAGENQLHAIFGGGPSYIVHPSDLAPTLVAFDAVFRIVGPAGERTIPFRTSSFCPVTMPSTRTYWLTTKSWRRSISPSLRQTLEAGTKKSWTATCGRTRYRVPVCHSGWTGTSVAPRVSCSVAWRQCRGESKRPRRCWSTSGSRPSSPVG